MTITEILEDLARDKDGRVGIEFLSLSVKMGRHDQLAAKLLLWLQGELLDPEVETVGDIDDVLDAAKWWHTLLSSMHGVEPQA